MPIDVVAIEQLLGNHKKFNTEYEGKMNAILDGLKKPDTTVEEITTLLLAWRDLWIEIQEIQFYIDRHFRPTGTLKAPGPVSDDIISHQ